MAVMAIMAWRGVDGIVRARDNTQDRLERTVRLNTVIAQWEQDLASIQDSGAVQPLSCDGASVRITRRTPDGLVVVTWSLRPDGNTSSWWRWTSPSATTNGGLQDAWMHSMQLQGTEPGQVRTLTGISQWQVYFYRNNAWSNCQSSADVVQAPETPGSAPTATPRTVLPTGVRLVLTFDTPSGLSGRLTRDTLLSVTTSLQ
ncbi:MAG: general secretion pathway protein GspJ [Proteobacteria bacterium]|nr:general secretion pathway protein GspJ [Pseudomonadota bacterium]